MERGIDSTFQVDDFSSDLGEKVKTSVLSCGEGERQGREQTAKSAIRWRAGMTGQMMLQGQRLVMRHDEKTEYHPRQGENENIRIII